MERLRSLALAGLLAVGMVACGPGGTGKFAVSNARVDPAFTCPNPADNYAYDVHGTFDADNQTGSTVTVESMSATTTTVASHGSWLGPIGETDDEPDLDYSPGSVAAGSKATIHFTIPFVCSDTPHTGVLDTYGDFAVHIAVVTSAGVFELDANKHRLTTP